MIKSRNEYYQYIKEKVSIKEVCDKLGIVTKSVGDDYVCSCIYHRDPHPSMHIYTGNKSFYCFECDKMCIRDRDIPGGHGRNRQGGAGGLGR